MRAIMPCLALLAPPAWTGTCSGKTGTPIQLTIGACACDAIPVTLTLPLTGPDFLNTVQVDCLPALAASLQRADGRDGGPITRLVPVFMTATAQS